VPFIRALGKTLGSGLGRVRPTEKGIRDSEFVCGRRATVERPRVRTADGSEEVQLATYRHFADHDPMSRRLDDATLSPPAGESCARV
jgi:hypothetical protein